MAWITPIYATDPVEAFPVMAQKTNQTVLPGLAVMNKPLLTCPAFDQLINPTQGYSG